MTQSVHANEQEALAQCFSAMNGISCESLPLDKQSRFLAKKKAIMDNLRYMAGLLADGSDEIAWENARIALDDMYGIEPASILQSKGSTKEASC